jgi:chemotaxis protein MotA
VIQLDKTSLVGIILGFLAVGVGMVMKGVNLSALLNPAAFLIIILGTIAAVSIAFPANELKKIPQLFKIIFSSQDNIKKTELIDMFSEWAQVARREGILVLEGRLHEIDDPFLKNGMLLAIDGKTPDYIRDVLLAEIDSMEERHETGAQIFTQAGTYAPTLGVLGAVIGLVAALGDMTDTEVLGNAISAAFIATLFGIFTGYVLWHPFANKLKRKTKQEVQMKYMMIEGILSIIEGEAPKEIEQKLSSFLPSQERQVYLEESRES